MIIQKKLSKIIQKGWKIEEIIGDRGYREKLEHILKIDVQEWEWDKTIFEEIMAKNFSKHVKRIKTK